MSPLPADERNPRPKPLWEERWNDAYGNAALSLLVPSVIVAEIRGDIRAPLAAKIAAALASKLAEPIEHHTFWDLEALESYHSDLRVLSTRALLDNRRRVASVNTLARSKLVKMGVAVANLALGGIIRAHNDRAAFELALRRALSQA